MRQIISAIAIAGTVLFTASCTTSADRQRDALLKEQAAQIETMKIEMARKHVIDSMNAIAMAKEKAEADKPAVAQAVTAKKSTTRSYNRNYVAGNASAYREPVYTQPAVYNEPVAVQQPQKKGWSAKAKGAVIGTAVGAGAGAVINKRNRAAGAVIGAVLGAGAGTGIGAVIDKKNGR